MDLGKGCLLLIGFIALGAVVGGIVDSEYSGSVYVMAGAAFVSIFGNGLFAAAAERNYDNLAFKSFFLIFNTILQCFAILFIVGSFRMNIVVIIYGLATLAVLWWLVWSKLIATIRKTGRSAVVTNSSSVQCGNCGEKYPAVNVWSCQCGFKEKRHVSKPCSNCGTLISHFDCDKCDMSIPVRQ